MPGCSERVADERGVVLVLALVFLVVVSIVATGILAFAGNDLLTSTSLTRVESSTYALDNAAEMAVQDVRYSGESGASQSAWECLPGGATMQFGSFALTVFCTEQPLLAANGSQYGREVEFFVCPNGYLGKPTTASECVTTPNGPAELQATVQFNDLSSSGVDDCNTSTSATCGEAMTIDEWLNDAS